MMNGRGKSDSAIVAERPTNKAGQPAAEPEERRAETEGNAVQQSTRRAQNRENVSQALDRIRQAARQRKKEKFAALLHHIIGTPRGGVLRAQGECRTRSGWVDVASLTRKALIPVSWTYTHGFIKEHIGPCRPGASTYPNRTVGNAHSRLPPLRTRSSNGRLSES